MGIAYATEQTREREAGCVKVMWGNCTWIARFGTIWPLGAKRDGGVAEKDREEIWKSARASRRREKSVVFKQ